jgi:hypothetical protein
MDLLERFRQHFQLAKEMTTESAAAETEAYLLLVEISRQDILWRRRYASWHAFLTHEGVPKNRWYHFHAGYQALGSEERARQLGRPVVCRLGVLRKDRREQAARQIRPDNYRAVLGENRGDRPSRYGSVTKRQLGGYVDTLKRALKRAGVPVPKEPW